MQAQISRIAKGSGEVIEAGYGPSLREKLTILQADVVDAIRLLDAIDEAQRKKQLETVRVVSNWGKLLSQLAMVVHSTEGPDRKKKAEELLGLLNTDLEPWKEAVTHFAI